MSGLTSGQGEDRPQIRVDIRDGMGQVVFHNPSRRNAMTLGMWKSLGEVAASLEQDAAVRAVILRGAGSKAFVSGDDVSEFASLRSTPEQEEHYRQVVQIAFRNLNRLTKPAIAVVEGACIGAGLSLALTADIRLAARGARFGIPAAKIGLGVEYEGVARLARLVGPSVAKDILFSARHLNASEALSAGLINVAIEDEGFDESVRRYVDPILNNAPLTIRCVKRAVALFERNSDSEEAAHEVRVLSAQCYASNDYQEGIKAFSDKRQPIFKGN